MAKCPRGSAPANADATALWPTPSSRGGGTSSPNFYIRHRTVGMSYSCQTGRLPVHRFLAHSGETKIVWKCHQISKNAKRLKHLKEVFHLYHINVKKRDLLQKYLIKNNVDAKVHYPIPIHLQKAAKYLKYKKGDFPIAEKMANTSLSLPVHEFIDEKHVKYMVHYINKFYLK